MRTHLSNLDRYTVQYQARQTHCADGATSKAPEEDKGETQEVIENNAPPAKEINVDAAVAAVLSTIYGIFTLKEEQRVALKTFLAR